MSNIEQHDVSIGKFCPPASISGQFSVVGDGAFIAFMAQATAEQPALVKPNTVRELADFGADASKDKSADQLVLAVPLAAHGTNDSIETVYEGPFLGLADRTIEQPAKNFMQSEEFSMSPQPALLAPLPVAARHHQLDRTHGIDQPEQNIAQTCKIASAEGAKAFAPVSTKAVQDFLGPLTESHTKGVAQSQFDLQGEPQEGAMVIASIPGSPDALIDSPSALPAIGQTAPEGVLQIPLVLRGDPSGSVSKVTEAALGAQGFWVPAMQTMFEARMAPKNPINSVGAAEATVAMQPQIFPGAEADPDIMSVGTKHLHSQRYFGATVGDVSPDIRQVALPETLDRKSLLIASTSAKHSAAPPPIANEVAKSMDKPQGSTTLTPQPRIIPNADALGGSNIALRPIINSGGPAAENPSWVRSNREGNLLNLPVEVPQNTKQAFPRLISLDPLAASESPAQPALSDSAKRLPMSGKSLDLPNSDTSKPLPGHSAAVTLGVVEGIGLQANEGQSAPSGREAQGKFEIFAGNLAESAQPNPGHPKDKATFLASTDYSKQRDLLKPLTVGFNTTGEMQIEPSHAPDLPPISSGSTVHAGGAGSTTLTVAQPQVAAHFPALVAQIREHAKLGKPTAIELTLSPEDLGKIRLVLTPEGDKLRIVMQAERPETMELLRRNIEAFSAELRQSGFSNTSFGFSGWGNAPQDEPKYPPSCSGPRFDAISAPAVPSRQPENSLTGTGLDLRV